MDEATLQSAFAALRIPKTHTTVGLSNLVAANKEYRSLFVNRRLPEDGWSDIQIQHFLFLLSTLDTNNKRSSSLRWCGVGEREGRIYSSLVANRHFGFAHGMGRSGDITEPQPKAVGSSVLVQLTLFLVLDAIRRGSGFNAQTAAQYGILLPLCTGMSMSLVLSSLREANPDPISSAGLTCVVIPTTLEGDEVVTHLQALEEAMSDKVLTVITTTSCFAPRVRDKVDQVAKLCQTHNVHHIINNAYGLQCASTSKLINRACVVGRVDAIVCSTDKNFLVPVGGAIVLSPHESIIQNIGKVYAGRASSSPILDLFITLLSMGLKGYQKLLQDRQQALENFAQRLSAVAEKHGERLLQCPSNTISFGITLDTLARPRDESEDETAYLESIRKPISALGAMLFSRCVSGTRVIPRQVFAGFGSSHDAFPHAYMTAACAIGVHPSEVDEFLVRLDKTIHEFKRNRRNDETTKLVSYSSCTYLAHSKTLSRKVFDIAIQHSER